MADYSNPNSTQNFEVVTEGDNFTLRRSIAHLPAFYRTPANEKFLTSIIIKLSAYFSKKSYQIIYNSKLSSLQHNKLGYKKEDNFIIPNGFETDIFKPNKMLKRDFLKKYNIRKSNTKIYKSSEGNKESVKFFSK